jgi:hypothetical protein
LLAFDYDGTLAPIVSDPEHAELRQTTRELLQSVANGYPCVVISGRPQQDLERHMRGICVFELIGDHGFDTGDRPSSNAESVKRGMQLWVQGQGWQSNQRRAQFNRANLRRYWAAEGERDSKSFQVRVEPHVRGLSHTQVLDIGTHVSERAELRGQKSFHIFVLPGAGSQHAQFDPSAWTYRAADAGTYTDEGMGPLMAAAYPDASTLIDLRPLRPLVFGQRNKALEADLVRTIHGFDALLVLTGSTASANL